MEYKQYRKLYTSTQEKQGKNINKEKRKRERTPMKWISQTNK